MQLKTYQQRSLDALGKYFKNCKQMGNANIAFYATTLELSNYLKRYFGQVCDTKA